MKPIRHVTAVLIIAAGILTIATDAASQLMGPSISPVAGADKTLTLRYRAPDADSVKASGNFPGSPVPMTKGGDGIWSVTLGPLAPNMYFYSFNVDGISVIDPSNPVLHPSVTPSSSIAIVPGDKPLFWEERDVPRGAVTSHRHRSVTLGDTRGFSVYTPPGYSGPGKEKYPVLYLLHGYTDTEETWRVSGRAAVILDNLIAESKARPMIVVMPYGYVPRIQGDGDGTWEDWFSRVTPRFERYVVDELVPMVEDLYRVETVASARAVAGLSMGGGQTLYLGLHNPDVFGSIGAFSSAAYEKFHGPLLADSKRLNSALDVFWIGCGKDDFLLKNNTAFVESLKARNIRHTFVISEGAHEWGVWRNYLHEFAPLLFGGK